MHVEVITPIRGIQSIVTVCTERRYDNKLFPARKVKLCECIGLIQIGQAKCKQKRL